MSAKNAIFITGGAKRVGAAMALYFARAGHDIALHYNSSESEALALQNTLSKEGITCKVFQADLADIAGLAALIERVKSAFPTCDTLINNASVFERKEFLETDEAFFDHQHTINFKAPFFLTQAFVKTFTGQKLSVVNILDTDISKNAISHFAYLLSKKSLADFTLMAARALGPNVRVNGVCPGAMLPSSQNEADYEERLKKLIPLQSHPSLDELSEATLWLSKQPHITGQIIYVDGGKHVI